MEPLRADTQDRLLLQVQGHSRLLLVPPVFALHGLAPFPSAHPYAGYSAPAVAATATCPAAPPQPLHRADSGTTTAGVAGVGGGPGGGGVAAAQPGLPSLGDAQLEAVLQLWPEFRGVRGKVCVLGPGQALWLPAGWFLHQESLNEGQGQGQGRQGQGLQGQGPQGQGPGNPFPSAAPSLPGNLVLVVSLGAASPGSAPRSRGALQLRAAQVLESWGVACVGSQARVRELLLLLAARLATAARPRRLGRGRAGGDAWQAGGVSGGLGNGFSCRDNLNKAGFEPGWDSCCEALGERGHLPEASWVVFPSGSSSSSSSSSNSSRGQGGTDGDGAQAWPEALAAFDGSSAGCHWLRLPVQAGVAGGGGVAGAGAGAAGSWMPDWDVGSLEGSRQVAFGCQALGLIEGLLAVPWNKQEVAALAAWRAELGGLPEDDSDVPVPLLAARQPTAWAMGMAAAAWLKRVCAARLLPTPWLDKLAHNDPLLLADTPYQYTLHYHSPGEAQFPELFQPQLRKREKAARKAAEAAHLKALKALTGPAGAGAARLLEAAPV
ncbi:hypothetical protein V8C86DRAFT_3132900 [Haematococcus lacustris]